MPRIKLKELERYGFSTTLTVRVSDLNYGAHLGYDRILTLAHHARLVLFEDWGVTEMDLGDGSTGLVAGDAAVNYMGEGFLHDELVIEIQPIEIGSMGFRLAHRFSRNNDRADVALAEVGFVGFDYESRRPHPLPIPFADKLKEL